MENPLEYSGDALLHLGQPSEARERYERTLRIVEECLGNENQKKARILNGLARTYIEQGEFGDVRALLVEGLRILHATFPEGQEVIQELASSMSLVDTNAIVLDDGRIVGRAESGGDVS